MIAALGSIQVLAVLFNVFRSKLLAILLGPEGIGAASVVDQAAVLVLQLSALSLPFASIRFLSRAHSQGPDAFRRMYSGLISGLFVLTSIGAVLCLAVVLWKPAWLGTELSSYQNLLIPALLSIPAMALHYYMVQVLAAAQQARLSGLLLLIIAVVQTGGALLGTRLDGLPGYYWATLICNYILVAGMLLFLRNKFSLPLLDREADLRREIRMNPDIVSFTLILFSISFTLPLSNVLARLAILRNFGEAETGLMQAAIALAAALNLVLNPANGLYLTPMMNRTAPVSEKVSAALEFQRKLLLLMPVVAVPMVLFAPLLLFLFYSSRFMGVSQVFYLFVIAQFVIQLAGIAQAVLIGLNDLVMYAVLVGSSQLSLGLIAWQLAPRWGIQGVALSYLISSLLVWVLCSVRLAARHGWSVPRGHWALGGYGLLGLALAGILFRSSAINVTTMLFAAGFYVIFSLGLVLLFGRRELHQILQRLSSTRRMLKSSK
jgi:O-antigen/teichoic acid export membrane protein